MISLSLLLVLGLASARLVHLIQDDSILDAPRDFLYDWTFKKSNPLRSFVYKMLFCYWCLGVWISALAVVAVVPFDGVEHLVTNVLAVACVQALICHHFEDRA